jgi:hypothetical protein
VSAVTHLLFVAVICLIGEPAPQAEVHRRLFPLSQRSGSPFHPTTPALHQTGSGRFLPSSSHGTGRVSFLRSRTSSRRPPYVVRFRHVGGVSSEHMFCNRTPTRHPGPEAITIEINRATRICQHFFSKHSFLHPGGSRKIRGTRPNKLHPGNSQENRGSCSIPTDHRGPEGCRKNIVKDAV